MKRRKVILWTLFLCYCLTAVLCLFSPRPLFSERSADTVPAASAATAPDTLFPEPDQTETARSHTAQEEAENTASENSASENTVQEAESPFPPVPFSCRTVFLPLNVRSMPSINSPVIAKIQPGEQGMVTGIIDTDWVSVLYQDINGYCAARYLEYTLSPQTTGEIGNLSDTNQNPPTQTEKKSPDVQTVKADIIKIVQGCYIRKEPDWRNPEVIIRVAEAGASYPHVPEQDTPSFYAIQLPDRSVAYVSVDYACLGEGEGRE